MPQNKTEERPANNNVFLSQPLLSVFMKTAMPIILIMLVNGSFTLMDAYFLGAFVGPEALTAVTLMFPAFMLIVALSTLVSSGYASVVSRLLGAGNTAAAKSAFAQAISLSLLVCALLISLFVVGGEALSMMVANGSQPLAQMGYSYIVILVWCSPLAFVLGINGDTLRCEGRMGLMAAISLASVLLNGLFNYYFIVRLEWGVAGSAYGSVLAQGVSIMLVAYFRYRSKPAIDTQIIAFSRCRQYWREFLALGAPSSLSYVGISLSSIAVLLSLQYWGVDNYDATVGAYGIVTRLMTFIFLPLLGLSMAFQTVVGNNFGAKLWARSNSSIKMAMAFALLYCSSLQLLCWALSDVVGGLFVDDAAISTEVARILPMVTLMLFLSGPLLIISAFFQAIGDAGRAMVLGLSKVYVFMLPLVFLLPMQWGESGIWMAGPVAEVMMLLLTVYVLRRRALQQGNPMGLYFSAA